MPWSLHDMILPLLGYHTVACSLRLWLQQITFLKKAILCCVWKGTSSQKTLYMSPVRVRYGMSFVYYNSDLYSARVISMVYASSFWIAPYYNGTQLYCLYDVMNVCMPTKVLKHQNCWKISLHIQCLRISLRDIEMAQCWLSYMHREHEHSLSLFCLVVVTPPVLNSTIFLTHWGRVTHICVSKLTIIGSDNGLSPGQRQAIIRTNAGILLIGALETNVSEILIKICTFSLKKMLLEMSSGKRRPSCLGLNVLIIHNLHICLTVAVEQSYAPMWIK